MLVDEVVEASSHPGPGPDSVVEVLEWGEEREEPEAPVDALDDPLPGVDVSGSFFWGRLWQVEDVEDDQEEEESWAPHPRCPRWRREPL